MLRVADLLAFGWDLRQRAHWPHETERRKEAKISIVSFGFQFFSFPSFSLPLPLSLSRDFCLCVHFIDSGRTYLSLSLSVFLSPLAARSLTDVSSLYVSLSLGLCVVTDPLLPTLFLQQTMAAADVDFDALPLEERLSHKVRLEAEKRERGRERRGFVCLCSSVALSVWRPLCLWLTVRSEMQSNASPMSHSTSPFRTMDEDSAGEAHSHSLCLCGTPTSPLARPQRCSGLVPFTHTHVHTHTQTHTKALRLDNQTHAC